MNGFWWFVIGFVSATILAVWWYRGNMKPWLDGLKRKVLDKIRERL